jgi:NADH-quinone oxidoreductase subunit C
MTFDQINDLITSELGSDIILGKDHQCLHISTDKIAVVAQFLFENENCYFDMLSCITALDNGVEKATMEVIYNLYSIPYEHKMMLKVVVPRNAKDEPAPSVPTLSHIWRTADWHEREAFDLVGIRFEDIQIYEESYCQKIGTDTLFAKITKPKNIIMVFK